jgi:hypothetical protein
VSLANLIVLPAAYFIVDNRLNNLAFHVPVEGVMFLVTPDVLLIIPFATVSVQTGKTGSGNPIQSLRSESKLNFFLSVVQTAAAGNSYFSIGPNARFEMGRSILVP